MKIGIPTMGDSGLDEQVSHHFGRAPTFTIVNADTDELRIVPNTSEHQGGSGKPPELMAENDVDIMLCSNLGPRAIKMFEDIGIEVYTGADGTVEETLESWRSGELSEATDRDACRQHRHG
ncbi:dinitrogenase iron-molybdenum cofactor biosynthesis protein [candidate division MSBL1 archaeon SCGC-AAA259D14]|uniref:Dinitrogenase iron-molybdenum cofactor biosynthesis protein n=3 Tax=candidate division MSBL1 TaxID=215777 RepID=A0A133U843_9EURY|nr:dinitrogenase iron-molybdenum cofactor biosynthesis protein [candidate division MSBL1 archaeon SCGC-AAA259B11]KXA90348.1 dinitrogenase iron-molybdenum cofactor biosynthesis protein [candidate division MSBL1 archaeon SCGC-AAA259D14]KXA95166.1 dinitrogenase iron-molybdenum cofactor biosynthesis protein [candidate division MSBL1 archaeon SCGC-AAA259I07]